MERWEEKNHKTLGHGSRTGSIRNIKLNGVMLQNNNLLGILSPQIHNSEALWLDRRGWTGRECKCWAAKQGHSKDGGLETDLKVIFVCVLAAINILKLQYDFFLFSLLHRAYCRVTQLLYQLMYLYKIYTLTFWRLMSTIVVVPHR